MKPFSLIGHTGCHNRGCEAILASTTAMIESTFGADTKFNLASFGPKNDERFVAEHQNVLLVPPGKSVSLKNMLFVAIMTKLGLRKMIPAPPRLWSLKKTFKASSAVLSVGGDMFTEDYGNPWETVVEPLLYAHNLGVKTCIWGASIGPFQDPKLKQDMSIFLKKITLITVREQLTVDYLKQELGVSENVRRVADPAFLLTPVRKIDIRTDLGLTKGPVIGLNISGHVARHVPGGCFGMVKACAEFVKKMTDEGNQFVLIPHDMDPRCEDNPFSIYNDHHVLNFLMEYMDIDINNKAVKILPNNLNAAETKDAISQCDYFIGAKTHSLIGALSSGIPSIGISYSPKTPGIFQDLFGHLDYVIPNVEFTANLLLEKLRHLQSTQNICRDTLNQAIPQRKALATTGAEYLRKCLA